MTPQGLIVPGLTWAEFLHTDHRSFLSQQMNPPQSVVRNAKRHGALWAMVRAKLGPLLVTSGYRCEGLNEAVGGVKRSLHVLGLATDNVPLHKNLHDAFCELAEDESLPYDAIIFEYGQWIHVQSPLTSSSTPRRLKLMKFASGGYETFRADDPRVQRVAKRRAQALNGAAHP